MTADSESTRPARTRRRRRALRVPVEGVPKPIETAAAEPAAEPKSRANRPSEPTKPIKQRASSPGDEKKTTKSPKRSRKQTRPLGGKPKEAAAKIEDENGSAASVDWDEVSRPSGTDIDENTLPDEAPAPDKPDSSVPTHEEASEAPIRASSPEIADGIVATGMVAVGESPAALLKAPKQRQHISEPPPPMTAEEAEAA